MLNRFLILLLAGTISLSLGCSSSSTEEKPPETEIDALDEIADESTGTSEGTGDVLADLGEDMGLQGDEAIDAPLPEEPMSTADSGDLIQETSELPPEPAMDTPAIAENTSEPTTEASTGSEDLFGGDDTPMEETPPPAPRPVVSLKKIKDVPYKQGDLLLNTVYLARDGDNMDSVAAKTGRSKGDLRKANSYLSRGVKVGDKIYYNSPNRPTDENQMLTYYEDNNIPAQTYVSKSGENIRDIAQQLLGNRESWKELWSTNMQVESKGALDEGTQLRYWPAGTSAPAPTMADNNQPIPEPFPETPPPADPGLAMNDPVADPLAAGTIEPPPPPPPSEPPPPPPPPQDPPKPPKMAKKDMGLIIPGLDKDTTIIVGGVALLAVFAILVMVIKRSRSRRISSTTQTQL